MDLWQRIRSWFAPRPRTFHLGDGLAAPLLELAQRQQRPPDDVAADLLSDALQQRQLDAENTRLWHNLTRREQEVAALICLNYTSDEIALRLVLSPETVKTWVRLRNWASRSAAKPGSRDSIPLQRLSGCSLSIYATILSFLGST